MTRGKPEMTHSPLAIKPRGKFSFFAPASKPLGSSWLEITAEERTWLGIISFATVGKPKHSYRWTTYCKSIMRNAKVVKPGEVVHEVYRK